MKKSLSELIIRNTCSKSLQKTIEITGAKITDWDLLVLIFNYAPNFEFLNKILNKIIGDKLTDEKTKIQAKKCLAFNNDTLTSFKKEEADCIYEIKIKEDSNSCEETYFAKTFKGAYHIVNMFCKKYNVKLNKESNIIFVKKRMLDNVTTWDLNVDFVGIAYLNNYLKLTSIDYYALVKYSLNKDSGLNEDDEGYGSYFSHRKPDLPEFLNDLELITYKSDNRTYKYGIVLTNCVDKKDNAAYCVVFNEDKFLQTHDEKDFINLLMCHVHIKYPLIEVAEMKNVPINTKKAYFHFVDLYNRYKN